MLLLQNSVAVCVVNETKGRYYINPSCTTCGQTSPQFFIRFRAWCKYS